MVSCPSCKVPKMIDVTEEMAEHAWAWADIMAWAAGTAGEVCTLLAQRFYQLENVLRPD